MAHRALYLANNSQIDQEILTILRSNCADVQVVTAIAQATALIESPSLSSDLNSLVTVIVADIAAGGIVLAEYVESVFGRSSGHSKPSAVGRPMIILLDPIGDVSIARKALRLGVDGYILSHETTSVKHDTMMRLLASAPPKTPGNTGGGASQSSVNGSNGNGHSNVRVDYFAEADTDATSLSRLSQIESAIMSCLSEHTGLPLSARSIVHEVMGRDMDEDKAASLIRPHISRLRSKVEPTPQMPQRLLTVRGKGYMFVC